MKEYTCKCGSTKKRFKVDIGDFFIDECCENKGYDHLGTIKEVKSDVAAVSEDKVKLQNKPGRGKLMEMNVVALKQLAAERGVSLPENLNKKQIVEQLLK